MFNSILQSLRNIDDGFYQFFLGDEMKITLLSMDRNEPAVETKKQPKDLPAMLITPTTQDPAEEDTLQIDESTTDTTPQQQEFTASTKEVESETDEFQRMFIEEFGPPPPTITAAKIISSKSSFGKQQQNTKNATRISRLPVFKAKSTPSNSKITFDPTFERLFLEEFGPPVAQKSVPPEPLCNARLVPKPGPQLPLDLNQLENKFSILEAKQCLIYSARLSEQEGAKPCSSSVLRESTTKTPHDTTNSALAVETFHLSPIPFATKQIWQVIGRQKGRRYKHSRRRTGCKA